MADFNSPSENRGGGARVIDTGTDELLARVEDRVAVLTLNRPHARNSLSDDLSPALRRMIAAFGADESIGCLLLTGAGTAFCAGGDVKGMGQNRAKRATGDTKRPDPKAAARDLLDRQIRLTGALYDLPKPTIAALPGPAAGAGLSIALACDLRIAAKSAFITTAFKNIGLSGDYGSSFFLSQLVGSAKARELFFTAERVSAEECERLGIVNRVVADGDLAKASLELAHQLATGPTLAYGIMKKNLDRALREDLHSCLAHEAEGLIRTAQTEDHREAVRAFIEKRSPEFRGH
ncbi:MAG: enoyl-CoA hydratase [bacterium]|nr:enoyl-CoA hydratase [bacterium]